MILLPAERPVLKLLLLACFWFVALQGRLCAPIIVKFGREEVAPSILLTAKVENFRGSFGVFRPKTPKNCVITQKMPENNFIFAHCRRIPWSKIMKLTTLMLLHDLHLCFNFGKIRFINYGFITKRNFGTKTQKSVFGPQRKNQGSDPKIISVIKIVLTSSICMQSLVEIDKRTATGERKNEFLKISFVFFQFVTLLQSAPYDSSSCRRIFAIY